MSDQSPHQELHEDVNEYFPGFDSVRSYAKGCKSEKKSLAAQMMAGAGALAALVIPFVICQLLFLGGSTVTLSTKVMNVQADVPAHYLVVEDPRMTDQEIQQWILENPGQGHPVPEDGSITLRGLRSRSPYRLIFYIDGSPETDGLPQLVGRYSFTTGRDFTPEPADPPLPLPAEPQETHPAETAAPTELPTEPAEEPEKPTEPARPTEPEPTKPRPKPKPADPPAPQPEPPAPKPPAPEPPAPEPPAPEPPAPEPPAPEPSTPDPTTPPPAPVVTPGTPQANFVSSTGGSCSFSAAFPFTIENAETARGEFIVTRTKSDGTVTEEPPIPATVEKPITRAASTVVLKLDSLEAVLGEQVSVKPVIYYKDGAGKEASKEGTAYEAAPAGLSSQTGLTLTTSYQDEDPEATDYELTISGYSISGKPADSFLMVESIEFVFLGYDGNPVKTYTADVNQTLSGTSFQTSGTLKPTPEEFMNGCALTARVKAVWMVGNNRVLPSASGIISVTEASSAPEVQIYCGTPEITSASAVPGSTSTNLDLNLPVIVEGTTPVSISIEAFDGSGNLVGSSNTALNPDGSYPGLYNQPISCQVSPGSSTRLVATVEYGAGKTQTAERSVRSINVSGITGSLNFINEGGQQKYALNVYDIQTGDAPDGGLRVGRIELIFTPSGGGEPITRTVDSPGQTVLGVPNQFSQKGTLDLSGLYGIYDVDVNIPFKWVVHGTEVMDQSAIGTIHCTEVYVQ